MKGEERTDTQGGIYEDLPLAGIDRILDVVITDNGAPRCRGSIHGGEQSQSRTRQSRAGQHGWGGNVCEGSGVAVHDKKHHGNDHTRELFVGEDRLETDKRHKKAADGRDDNTQLGSQLPVRHGGQSLSTGDAAHR